MVAVQKILNNYKQTRCSDRKFVFDCFVIFKDSFSIKVIIISDHLFACNKTSLTKDQGFSIVGNDLPFCNEGNIKSMFQENARTLGLALFTITIDYLKEYIVVVRISSSISCGE